MFGVNIFKQIIKIVINRFKFVQGHHDDDVAKITFLIISAWSTTVNSSSLFEVS